MIDFIIIAGFIFSFVLVFFIILLTILLIKQDMLMLLEQNEKEGE